MFLDIILTFIVAAVSQSGIHVYLILYFLAMHWSDINILWPISVPFPGV